MQHLLPPHLRGSTPVGERLHVWLCASPAPAGIDLMVRLLKSMGYCFPRTCGDRPSG